MASPRLIEPEHMDDPALPESMHLAALRGLDRINRLSATTAQIWRDVAAGAETGSTPTILDVGCGGGDLAVGLWRRARQTGIDARVIGADISERALQRARAAAHAAHAAVEFTCLDAVTDAWPPNVDVIVSSLFLHHLDETRLPQLLRRCAGSEAQLVVMSDLRRSAKGYLLALAGTRLLSRSPVVHHDGPQSVRAALTPGELEDLATHCGLANAAVVRSWPARLRLVWRRP